MAIRVGLGAVVGCAKLYTRDIANACDAPLSVRFHDDVAELLGRGEAAKCLDTDLIGRGVGDWRLVQHAR